MSTQLLAIVKNGKIEPIEPINCKSLSPIV
jgi:hypothetical protein